MTNSKTTKRALLSSVVALLLCFTMLLGTTFAWFTDSAESKVNTIQAGTLDVELQTYTNSTWGTAGETIAFNKSNILWEPGCTYTTELIRLKNNGNLALKFDLVVSGGITTKADGTPSDVNLMDALEITYLIHDTAGDIASVVGKTVTASSGTVKGTLPEQNDVSNCFAISVHMKEDAGNAYQGLKLDGITVAVSAQQAPYEEDSINGSNYDAYIEALSAAYLLNDTYGARVSVEVKNLSGITGTDSFYINILDANGNVMNTIKPTQALFDLPGMVVDGKLNGCTACAFLTIGDEYWGINPWNALDVNNAPAKAVLVVNGVEKSSIAITAVGTTTWGALVDAHNTNPYPATNP